MNLFSKKKSNEELKKISEECLETIKNFINTTNDANRLNMIFTEVTIFRMKYDKKDNIWQNYKDRKRREQNLERNLLLVIQLEDIFDNIEGFKTEEHQELNSLMNRVLPHPVLIGKNGWQSFWNGFLELFDKGSGKK
mgnify:CR=1 FL=1